MAYMVMAYMVMAYIAADEDNADGSGVPSRRISFMASPHNCTMLARYRYHVKSSDPRSHAPDSEWGEFEAAGAAQYAPIGDADDDDDAADDDAQEEPTTDTVRAGLYHV